jgi:hypothetical protein
MKKLFCVLLLCLGDASAMFAQSGPSAWMPHPDAIELPGIPHGRLEAMEAFES